MKQSVLKLGTLVLILLLGGIIASGSRATDVTKKDSVRAALEDALRENIELRTELEQARREIERLRMTLSLQASVATSSAPSAARTHVVTKGESLGRIAAHYYGSVDAWKKIYEANRNTISDPNKIFPGQKLVIP